MPGLRYNEVPPLPWEPRDASYQMAGKGTGNELLERTAAPDSSCKDTEHRYLKKVKNHADTQWRR